MVVMQCKCGKGSMRFDRLNKQDFPTGWHALCCEEAAAKEINADTVVAETDSTTPEPKKRGRKPWKQG